MVRRALPHVNRRMVGPFIFLDQMGPVLFRSGQGLDVRPHPHIGLATVTYLFDGRIMHRDSLGNALEITPGAMNLMTAGRGIAHSERSPDAARVGGENLYGIQSWIALPEAKLKAARALSAVLRQAVGTGAGAQSVEGLLLRRRKRRGCLGRQSKCER